MTLIAPSERLAPRAEPALRELKGVVERITYQNPDNGYTVARLVPEGRSEPSGTAGDDRLVTLVGALADLTPGEAIVARGWWRNDPKHGWQFQAQDYQTTLPASLQGMKKYLGSGLVKGVGPVMAARIVDLFGEATFRVIDQDADRLRAVPGIGPVRARRIAATWAEQRHIREVMAALQGYGVSTSLAVRIYKQFGDDSGRVIAQEPYRLAREVWGIGFKTADKIAQAVGVPPTAPQRLEAGALHVLATAADDGHTLLPLDQLMRQTSELLGVSDELVHEALGALQGTGELTPAARAGDDVPLLALMPFARAESNLAARLRALASCQTWAAVSRVFGMVNWTAAFAWLGTKHQVCLAPEQEAAVRMALTAPVSLLTGGPGTGKTHTLRALLLLARAKGLRCLLAAPTGRAAKRMEEATGVPASTLHRLLELRPGAGRTQKILQADLVVVDEVSMLDALLANQLLRALRPGTHLLLVGDPDQLPSVGAGDVLADLLRAGVFPVTQLERIFRQGAGSGIAENARRVKSGLLPRFGGEVQDCFFVPAADPSETAQIVVDLVTRRLPARYGLAAAEIQVLAPMHRGEAGVGLLNQVLQAAVNPAAAQRPELRAGGRSYRVGDRVLQLKNDYDLGVFNGDLGTVSQVDPVEQELSVVLDDGRQVQYPSASLFALTHAYAISVHKAQGAEFPAVVIPLLTSHAPVLGRTLLYTALTRARQLAVLVGQRKALALAVQDWRRAPRSTALDGLLTGTLHYSALNQLGPSAVSDEAGLGNWEGLLEGEEDREQV